MRKFTLFLFLSLMALFASLNLSAQYAVSGAEDPDANGIYYENSTENGKPLYSNGNYSMFYVDCNTKWAIGNVGNCPEYSTYSDGDVPTNDLWHKGGKYKGSPDDPIMVAKLNSITYDRDAFIESDYDDGRFEEEVNIFLYATDNSFTGANNEDFVVSGKVVVSNLPTGLTAVIRRTSDSTLRAVLTGSAMNHTRFNNVDNLTFEFQNSAFSNNDASAIGYSTRNNLKILYMEKLLVSGATITPDVNNVFVLTGLYNGKPIYSNGDNNIYYKGCTWGAQWALGEPGSCPKYSTAVSGDLAPSSGWYNGGGGDGSSDTIYINHVNSLAYINEMVLESANDDGSIEDSIIIEFIAPANNNTFTGTNGDDFIASGKVVVSNLPEGITAVITRISDVSLLVKFSGAATEHEFSNSIYNLGFEFKNSAFSGGDASAVDNYFKNDYIIQFLQKYEVIDALIPDVNGTYISSGFYNGKTIYSKGEYRLGYRGCTAKWVIIGGDDDSRVSSGNCPLYSTEVDGDTPPYNGWGEGGRGGFNEKIYVIPHNSIIYNPNSIFEALSNDGTINDTLAITYYYPMGSNVFTGTNGDDFIADGKIIVSNLPAGLTAVAERTSDTTITIKFTGAATSHKYTDNINNLAFEFQNSAFSEGDAVSVPNYLKDDIAIVFLMKYEVINATSNPGLNGTYVSSGYFNDKLVFSFDEYRLGYRGCGAEWVIVDGDNDDNIARGYCPESRTDVDEDLPPLTGWHDVTLTVYPHNSLYYSKTFFMESDAGDGSINNDDTLVIRYFFPENNAIFSGTNDDDFVAAGKIVVSNLPAGLAAVATRTSDTTLAVIFTGNAINHNFADNILNLTFEFQNTAFTGVIASDIFGYIKDDLVIQFLQKYEVIDAVSTPAVNGTYISSGFYNGKPIYSKGEYRLGYRDCNAKWVIIGGDDDNNVERGNCPLYSTEVDGDTPPYDGWGVGGSGGSSGEIIYVIPHNTIMYSSNGIVEDLSNDGTINDTLALTYYYPAGSNVFTGSNGDDFIADGKIIVSNLPAGLTAVAERTSDTTITIKFTGAATSHNYTDNINNLAFEFQNSAFSEGDAVSVNNYLKDDIAIVFLVKYEVFNATSNPDLNGTYVSSGYFNDKLVFSFEEYRLGYRGCGAEWVIVDGDNDNNVAHGYCPQSRTDVGGDLPPHTGWHDETLTVYPHNSLYYSRNSFNESYVDEGSIDNADTLVIRYFFPENNAIFSGTNDDDFVADGKVVISNLPVGLTAAVVRTSDTTLAVVLTGMTGSGDVNNLTFVFSDEAFSGIDAANVFYSTRNDIEIDFHNEYYVASTGGDFTTITEAVGSSKVKDGDVLILAAETFTETGINVTKSLTFRGQGAGKTIVQANAAPATATNRIFYMNFSSNNYKNITFESMSLKNGNIGDLGGGIYSRYCNLTIKNCEIANNRSTYYYGQGGAICFSYGKFIAENTTFSGNSNLGAYNSSYYGGGAVYLYSPDNTASISNCTFSGNSNANQYGGALLTYCNLKITNSTFENNTANYGGGIYHNGGTIEMVNVLVANNTATTSGNDIYGSVTANYCLIEDVTGVTITGSNNVTGSDPELSALAHNGGSTQTCAISSTSPAKDAGTNEEVPELDQRGVTMYNGIRDIGAYEYNTTPLILVSDTLLNFGNVAINDSSELYYSISAINLTNDMVITAPAGFEISGYSGSEFADASPMTIVPGTGSIADTIIYVKYKPVINGNVEDVITNASTDAETVNVSVKAKAVYKPTGDNESFMMLENNVKYFVSDDFTFDDQDGDVFAGIQIVTKETNGDLEYNGVNVDNGTVCDDLSKLVFKLFENESGAPYATFTFKVKDNTGLYSEETYTMAIDVNDIPAGANDAVTTSEDVNKTFAAGDFTFTNTVGSFDGINIVSAETSGDLEYNGADVTASQECADVSLLVFKPVANENGSSYATFEFKVKDDLGEISAESYTMTIDVTAVNDAPTLANAIPDGDATAGVAYTYVVPENTFADIDDGDVLTYTATLSDNSSLPAWLTFTAATRTFSGTPTSSGNITIKVTATDVALANVSDEYVLTIASGTGIDDLFGTNLQVYPNPTSGLISISLKNNVSEVRVEITDVIGKAVIIKTLSDSKTDIDLSGYAKGVYFIKLSNGEETVTRKIVVQ